MMAPPIDGAITRAEWATAAASFTAGHRRLCPGADRATQPGVELGKRFTYAMLGRSDAGKAREEWELLPKSDPSCVI